MVLGKISENTSITKVRMPVAIAMPVSPASRMPIIVAMAEAAMLIRLLQIKIRLSSTSVLLSNFSASFAPLWPCAVKWRIL